MTELQKLLGPYIAKMLMGRYNTSTISEANAMSDEDLIKVRGLGKMAIYKIRNATPLRKNKLNNTIMKQLPVLVGFRAKTGELEFNEYATVILMDETGPFTDIDAEQNAIRERAVYAFKERFNSLYPESELISATACHVVFDYPQVLV